MTIISTRFTLVQENSTRTRTAQPSSAGSAYPWVFPSQQCLVIIQTRILSKTNYKDLFRHSDGLVAVVIRVALRALQRIRIPAMAVAAYTFCDSRSRQRNLAILLAREPEVPSNPGS